MFIHTSTSVHQYIRAERCQRKKAGHLIIATAATALPSKELPGRVRIDNVRHLAEEGPSRALEATGSDQWDTKNCSSPLQSIDTPSTIRAAYPTPPDSQDSFTNKPTNQPTSKRRSRNAFVASATRPPRLKHAPSATLHETFARRKTSAALTATSPSPFPSPPLFRVPSPPPPSNSSLPPVPQLGSAAAASSSSEAPPLLSWASCPCP